MAWNWNEIQSVLKEETFKTWRERTNELIEQQNNFVSWQAAIDSRWYVTDTSSSTTTYTGVTSPGATGTDSLVAGYFIVFRPATNNTGASTLNIASSDGAVDIKKIASGAKVALAADDLDSDNYAELIFDGTDWLMMNAPIDALPTQSGNAGKFLTTDASTASWATVDIDNLPAFYAYKSGVISLADGVSTTLLLDESYDPDSAYDATTGKFIPQTAGKYLVQVSTSFHISSVGHLVVAGELTIRKNGSTIVPSTLSIEGTGMMNWVPMCNFGIVAMNGSSDYLTATMYCYNYTNNDATNARQSGFSAFLIKAD